ncbi:MAG: hypothetical protein WDN26_18655 [Chitinophagaceae bacterium]
MKATTKVIAAVGLLAIAGAVIYASQRRKSRNKRRRHEYMSQQVADHGYETAHDILFPNYKQGRGMYAGNR